MALGSKTEPNQHACKCLNVRINPRPPPNPTPSVDPDYTPIYVGEEGISVAHTQLTLRSRSRTKEDLQGTESRLTRYTSLTCVVCQTLVYRVFQVITPDVDSAEGPIQPSEEVSEEELLKSTTGWIEIYKDCITGEVIKQAELSPLYSRTFCIVLPSGVSSSTPSIPSYSPPSQSSQDLTPRPHLPHLPPLFLPPPFTPAHQVFRHISTKAIEESNKIRATAEEYLSKIVAEKVAEVEARETKLRQEVELIWSKWRETISKIEDDAVQRGRPAWAGKRRQSTGAPRSTTVSPTRGPHANGLPASVRITEFVPTFSPPRRPSVASAAVQESALSASLATSSFHHPRAQAERSRQVPPPVGNGTGSPPPYSSNPPSPSVNGGLSPVTASSRTMALPISEATTIREAYRRNMNEAKDIATSFKYVMDMEAKMEEIQRQQQQRDSEGHEEIKVASTSQEPPPHAPGSSLSRGRSPKTNKSAIKKPKSHDGNSKSPTRSKRSTSSSAQGEQTTPSKGKRKVTFDVKPEVTIIGTDVTSLRPDDTPWKDEPDAIFEMENEIDRDDSTDTAVPASPITFTTPSAEPIRSPRRPNNHIRASSVGGLPSSLSTLRPASLPVPSLLRSPPPREIDNDRPRSELVRESLLYPQARKDESTVKQPITLSSTNEGEVVDEDLDPRQAEILKLVAASTPSHRSAWKKDSKAWQLFVSRQGRKAKDVDRRAIAEEEEDSTAESTSSRAGYEDESDGDTTEDSQKDSLSIKHGIPSSLPIPMPLAHLRNKFAGPTYEPKTSLTDKPGVLVPSLHKVSSAAMRRASYIERDRMRMIDPGTLDFAADEEEEEDNEADPELNDVGGKGRQRALKILRARNEIPSEGMWRSLAS
ncbi:hypothetical protein C8Q75DRAFT_742506 [Abortiporus biennis]|nr:hypothetical protein C8Q75DRAFT_742506 [Abortiporus biennis]